MKVLLTSLGTPGNFQIALAPAIALKQAGHEVTLASSPEFVARARLFGIDFIPVGPNIADLQYFENIIKASHVDVQEQLKFYLATVFLTFLRLPMTY